MKPRDRLAPTLEAARALARDETPISADRIEHAMVLVAFMVASGQTKLAPLLDRLERELEIYRRERDPVSRAQRILRDHTLPAVPNDGPVDR